MQLQLDVGKSTCYKRYYSGDANSINKLLKSNGEWGVQCDYPAAREFFSSEIGIDTKPFQKIMTPYAHCDGIVNLFTQSDESLDTGQAKVRLTFSPGVFQDGVFYLFTPDHLLGEAGLSGNNNHVLFTASLIYDGENPYGYEKGVIGSRIKSAKSKGDLITREAAAWASVLTDLRYVQTDKKGLPFSLFYTVGGFYGRDMKGEQLRLSLSQEMDLPWLVDNSRKLLEELADDSDFQKLVEMKRAILDAKNMLSGKNENDNPEPLSKLGESVAAYSALFTESLFTEKVTSKSADVKAAVQSFNKALEDQLCEAEDDSASAIIEFHQRNNPRLNKFLQNI